jgi:hypothetical protein
MEEEQKKDPKYKTELKKIFPKRNEFSYGKK